LAHRPASKEQSTIGILHSHGDAALFNIPIEKITIEDIEQFLKSGAKEGTLLDFKEEFPKRLEKAISSMANTFGGMILIGVEETDTGGGVTPIKGLPLKPGLRETVIQIGIDSIYPPLIPEVRAVDFKSDPALSEPDRAIVVIRVHESAEAGHAVDQRTTVYVRADNVSDWMRKATVEESEWFHQKRQKSLAEKARIIKQAQHHAQEYVVSLRTRHQRPTSEPRGRFVVWTVPTFPRLPIAIPKAMFDETFGLIRRNYPIFPGSFPFGTRCPVVDGLYLADDESSELYFTEIHQQGLIYTEHEFRWDKYQADGLEFVPSGAAMLLRVAAEFGCELYEQCGYFGLCDLHLGLVGIKGGAVARSAHRLPKMMDDTLAVERKISSRIDNESLFSICKEMIREVYWDFGWEVDDNRLVRDFG
jgi:Putative DNA-binding domain